MTKKSILIVAKTMEFFAKDTQQLPTISQPIQPAPSGTQSTGLTSDGNWDIPAATGAEDTHT